MPDTGFVQQNSNYVLKRFAYNVLRGQAIVKAEKITIIILIDNKFEV